MSGRPRDGLRPPAIRLPGFLNEEDIGLGDLVGKAAAMASARPCGGCERRAEALNRWLVIAGRRPAKRP